MLNILKLNIKRFITVILLFSFYIERYDNKYVLHPYCITSTNDIINMWMREYRNKYFLTTDTAPILQIIFVIM